MKAPALELALTARRYGPMMGALLALYLLTAIATGSYLKHHGALSAQLSGHLEDAIRSKGILPQDAPRSPNAAVNAGAAETPHGDRAGYKETIRGLGNAGTLGVALRIFKNNAIAVVAILVFSLVPFVYFPVIAILTNGVALGIVMADRMHGAGWLSPFLRSLLPHGVTELTAIFLAASLGIALCTGMTRRVLRLPPKEPIDLRERAARVLRPFVLLVLPLLLVSAFIEAFVTPRLF